MGKNKFNFEECLNKQYILKSYISSEYSGLTAQIKDYNYRDTNNQLLIFVEYSNGVSEWRPYSDFIEYSETENPSESEIDFKLIEDLKLGMFAGIVIGCNLPPEYLAKGDELIKLKEKIKQMKQKLTDN